MSESATAPPQPSRPPPRAFTQGVGLLFQWIGVTLFCASLFVCCASSLLSRETATQTNLARAGWGPYSAQRALTVALPCAVFFGMGLAGLGLGLQAQGRHAPWMSVALTTIASLFWTVHALLFATVGAWTIALICLVLAALFGVLLAFALGARREMRRDPPPPGHEVLPADYKVPYSHIHQDPPEVRLARELDQRRQRLAVQQKELELLEEKLKRKLKQTDE